MACKVITTPLILPQELICMIIDTLIPSNPLPIALNPSHITTKTLLSLLRTSRTIYPIALRHLYTNCLYIDNFGRLLSLTASVCNLRHQESNKGNAFHNTLPRASILPHLTSLYLAPDFDEHNIANAENLRHISDLLLLLAPTLKRLILSTPARNSIFSPSLNRRVIINLLWDGLSPLKQLEVFSSVSDPMDFLLDDHAHLSDSKSFRNIFDEWPKCRVLALYNPDLSNEKDWRRWSKMPCLERLILNRVDGIEQLDIKAFWKELPHEGKRKLEVELVNVESGHRVPMGKENWKEDDAMQIQEINVPISYYGDEDEIELCRKWVTRCLLNGDESIKDKGPSLRYIM